VLVLDLIFGLLPLDVPPPASPGTVGSSGPVAPVHSSGYAAILGGFFALGLIILAGILLSLKPKRADPGPDRGPGESPPEPPDFTS
jgi:hypothetical protein